MRTTIDMPDALLKRVKTVAAQNNTTFRALVVNALEQSLDASNKKFYLDDASVGPALPEAETISNERINEAIDGQRNHHFAI